jgi:tetratricopeptide (TPR) repeat protein
MTAMKQSKILTLFSRPFITVPLLLFLVAISYANTLYSPFVLDDIHSFLEEPNVYVRDFSYESFNKLSSTVFGKARLIPIATFSLNHYFAKGQMPIYHITNIAIHLFATLAVYWFIAVLLRTPVGKSTLRGIPAIWFSFFVAALWALNPVQTNAVTYIVQRMTSISALFYIATLTFYIQGRLASALKPRRLFYAFSAGTALCALFSKENSFMLPVAILLVEWLFISPNIFMKILKRMKWYHWIGIFLIAAALFPLFEHRLMGILKGFDNRSFTLNERLLTEARVVVYYISLLILPWPGRMNFDYDFPVSTSVFSPPGTLLSLVLLGLLLSWSFRKRNQYPLITFGIFWYFLNLLIESTVVPLEIVFEHRLYLPSVGFYVACLAALDLVVAYMKTKRPSLEVEQLFVLAMVLIMTFFSIGTSVRNNVWRDSYALYNDTAEKSPNNPRAHLNLGVAMGRNSNLERESIEEFKKVIPLGKPKRENYIEAANNIVVAYCNLGEFEEAIVHGKKYLEEAPGYVSGKGYPKLMNSLAYAYNKTGQYSEAMQALATGMTTERKRRLNVYHVKAMAQTLSDAYEHEEFREKLEISEEKGDKSLAVGLRMARLLSDLKDYEKANKYLRPIIKTYPDHELAKELNEKIQDKLQKNRKQQKLMNVRNHPPYNESMTYRVTLDMSDFIIKKYSTLRFMVGWLLDKAEKASQPDDPFVLWYRVKWYKKIRNKKKLAQELEEAVILQPDFVPILKLAGYYYEVNGNMEKAVEIYTHILELYPGGDAWLGYEKKIAEYNESISEK